MKINLNTENLKKVIATGMVLVTCMAPVSAMAFDKNVSENYTIKKGDRLYNICKEKYERSDLCDEVMNLNGITDATLIRVGDNIYLPSLHEVRALNNKYAVNEESIFHEVVKGDTLERISYKYYGTTGYAKLLEEYNEVNPYRLTIGSCIFVPTLNDLIAYTMYQNEFGKKENDKVNNDVYNGPICHTVCGNDTLAKISTKYYGKRDYAMMLASYNNISNVYNMQKGSIVIVPSLEELISYNNSLSVKPVKPVETSKPVYNKDDRNEVRVLKNDTYNSIAKRVYGTSDYGWLLSEINGNKALVVGKKCFTPSMTNLLRYASLYKDLPPSERLYNYYFVEEGDTLSRVSYIKYGSLDFVDYLAQENGNRNKNFVKDYELLYTPHHEGVKSK